MDMYNVAIIFYMGTISMAAAVVILTIIYTSKIRGSKQASTSRSPRRQKKVSIPLFNAVKKRVSVPRFNAIKRPKSKETAKPEATEYTPQPEGEPVNTELVNNAQSNADQETQSVDSVVSSEKEPNMEINPVTNHSNSNEERQLPPDETLLPESSLPSDSSNEKHASSPDHSTAEEHSAIPEFGIVETPHNPSPGIPVTIVNTDTPPSNININAAEKEDKSTMDTKETEPSVEAVESGSEQTGAKQESGDSVLLETNKTNNEEPSSQKMQTDDLSDLFTKNVVEENDVSRLAQGMADVDVKDLLEEGRQLLDRLRKPNG